MKYHVERRTLIDAPLSKVQPLVENFNEWNKWSPWTIAEPDCPIWITGEPGQQGHQMQWDGQVIGSGRNTLKSSDAHSLHYNLEFFKPWKSKAEVSFLFEERNGQTNVIWSMDSSMPFFLFFMIKVMKNWIGMDYERGLRMLKEIAEKGQINCHTANRGIVDHEGFSYVGIQRVVPYRETPTQMKQDFDKIVNDVVVDRKKGAKHWVSIYPRFNMKNMMVTYIAAVSDEDLKSEDLGPDYIKGDIKSTKALEITHDGPYDFLGNAWAMGMMHTRAKKVKGAGFPFEQYWNSPLEVAPEELKTSVFFPVK